jgi:protein-tyrosine phosphatase
MPGRAELHFHLLPGVDDGPATIEESVELARRALADKTTTITCTPHVRDVVVAEIPERVAQVRARLADEGVAVDVLGGGELAQEDVASLTASELAIMAQGPPHARWLLLEAPLFDSDVDALGEAADELRARGYGVLIGHPERSPWLFAGDRRVLRRELDLGSRLQLNAPSFTGEHGADARARALELAGAGAAHLMASDAHRLTRGPALSAGAEAALAAGIDRAVVRRLVDEGAPRALADGIPAAAAGAVS